MYMYVALFRKKENNKKTIEGFDKNHGSVTCIREIGKYKEYQVIKKLEAAISNFPGTWRIYRSINKRNFDKAFKDLQTEMIKGNVPHDRVDTKWKSILMSPKNKIGRGKWLIDIDDRSSIHKVIDYLKEKDIPLLDHFNTPNGQGIIVDPFDSRDFNFDDVSIKKDALRFIKKIIIEGENK